MSLTGDRYVGAFRGHAVELVRDNWAKTLVLLIDGKEVARASRVLPHDIRLVGSLEVDHEWFSVVATSVIHGGGVVDRVEVDGAPLPLEKVK